MAEGGFGQEYFFLTKKFHDPASRFLPLLRKTKTSLRLSNPSREPSSWLAPLSQNIFASLIILRRGGGFASRKKLAAKRAIFIVALLLKNRRLRFESLLLSQANVLGALRLRLCLRRGRDSNPRYLAVYRLSKAAHSATMRPLRVYLIYLYIVV